MLAFAYGYRQVTFSYNKQRMAHAKTARTFSLLVLVGRMFGGILSKENKS